MVLKKSNSFIDNQAKAAEYDRGNLTPIEKYEVISTLSDGKTTAEDQTNAIEKIQKMV